MASALTAMCPTYNVHPSVVARQCAEVFCSEDFNSFTISCTRCSREYNLFNSNAFVNHIRECFADNNLVTWKVFSEDLPRTLVKNEAVNELLSINGDKDVNLNLEQHETKVPLQEFVFQKSEFGIEEANAPNHACQEDTTANPSKLDLLNQTDLILSVISFYKNKPFLWDANLPSYFDIPVRKEAYLYIAKFINIQFNTNITDSDIRKLIARLRAEYRSAQRSKDTTNRVWYYDKLSFLDVKFEILQRSNQQSASHSEPLNDVTASITNYEKTKKKVAEKKPLKCDLCNLQFLTRSDFTNHNNELHPKRFKCDYCDFSSKERFNINIHMQRHRGINRYPCDLCGKKFVTSTEMNLHRRIHTGEKPNICEICGMAFRMRSVLIMHVKRHNNRRDFKCEECESTFYTNQSLRRHMVVHKNERPYKCQICDAAFKLPKTLKQHIKLHMPVKKYSCTICEKKFAQAAGLSSHKKTHETVIAFEA